ncbi:MAG: epoxyqueuosine reductase QueH [Clostridia bacterium]|nr:epoxyqueuosine reductase QueH [Clostridia bacterium]
MITINYQLELDKYIESMQGKEKLALHSCCGPCSSYVIEYLSQYFDITVFFYNPNIHPNAEYEHRLSEQKRLCEIMNIPMIDCDYLPDDFFNFVKGLENEKEGGQRCTKCFEMRLDYTAKKAKQNGFALFATTLTVSPHKNAPLINGIGESISKKYDIKWLPSDFKKRSGYLRSIRLSEQYELYRQNYCGCVFSKQKAED